MTDINSLAKAVTKLQDHFTALWHEDLEAKSNEGSLLDLIVNQHRQNFDLWHEEDKAREPGVADNEIAQVKRNIDGLNQTRNDMITQIDEFMADGPLRKYQDDTLPWNSETLGSIIDRLSIASLKVFHMKEQTERTDATEEHLKTCEEKVARLLVQQTDLATSLQDFLTDIVAGKRQNKLYRQFKMYNDPTLNPRIYSKPDQ